MEIARGVRIPHLAHNGGTVASDLIETTTSPISLPLAVDLPALPDVAPGSEDVSVARGTAVTLAPGPYGHLAVARDATVEFGPGEYVFASMDVARGVTAWFTPETSLAVVGPLVVDREFTLLELDSGIDEGLPLPVAVLAADADVLRPASDPAVRIGRDSVLSIELSAPAGTVVIDRDTALQGSVVANRISVARDVEVTYSTRPAAAPVVVLGEPRAGATVGGLVTLRAEQTAGPGVEHVDFLVDGVTVGSAASPPFELVWDATTVPDGPHVLTAQTSDRAGGLVSSGPVTVEVRAESDPAMRLEADRTNGLVTAEDYARFGVYRWFAPDRVPEQYRPHAMAWRTATTAGSGQTSHTG